MGSIHRQLLRSDRNLVCPYRDILLRLLRTYSFYGENTVSFERFSLNNREKNIQEDIFHVREAMREF